MPRIPTNADFRAILADLPVPGDYYTGAAGWSREPPRDILIFARRAQEEAIDGGVHQHPRYVLCWCVEGTGTIIVDGATLRGISPGQTLLLFPYQQHYFTEFAGAGILWVFVSFALPAHCFLNPLTRNLGLAPSPAPIPHGG